MQHSILDTESMHSLITFAMGKKIASLENRETNCLWQRRIKSSKGETIAPGPRTGPFFSKLNVDPFLNRYVDQLNFY